jgi:uncharacterized protein involved in outer membrane biogenesis
MSRRRLAHWVAVIGLGLFGVIAIGSAVLVLWLTNADLKPILESEGSDRLQRRITVGTFKIRWGDPLAIEISDLRIANTGWGSVPEMVRVGHLSALVDVLPLFRGVLSYEKLRIEDATVVLERDQNGTGNWKFGSGKSTGGLAVVPKNRTQYPILIDAALARGLVTYRTSSGKILRISLDRVVQHTGGEQMPITLQGEGAYNDVPGTFEAKMQSTAVLWDASKPFGTNVTFSADDATVNFDGTLEEPLDFEGALGRLTFDARALNSLLKLFEVEASANVPLVAAGVLKRNHNDWSLSEAKGNLATNEFTGNLAMHEGGRGKPDNISIDWDFKMLDIDALMAEIGKGNGHQRFTEWPLRLDLTGITVEAQLSTDQSKVAARRFAAASLDTRLADGVVTLRDFRLALAGGEVRASGVLSQTTAGGKLALTGYLAKAEAAKLAQWIGAADGKIRGRLDGGATIEMTGETVGTALKTSEGAMIITMNDGDVARALVEQASTDLRALFRTAEGRIPIGCLLGVLTLKNGAGELLLRLDSSEARLAAAGTIDIASLRLDLTLKSDRDTTGVFALDAPITIRGPLNGLKVTPLAETEVKGLGEADRRASVGALPASLQKLVRGSDCIQGPLQ